MGPVLALAAGVVAAVYGVVGEGAPEEGAGAAVAEDDEGAGGLGEDVVPGSEDAGLGVGGAFPAFVGLAGVGEELVGGVLEPVGREVSGAAAVVFVEAGVEVDGEGVVGCDEAGGLDGLAFGAGPDGGGAREGAGGGAGAGDAFGGQVPAGDGGCGVYDDFGVCEVVDHCCDGFCLWLRPSPRPSPASAGEGAVSVLGRVGG